MGLAEWLRSLFGDKPALPPRPERALVAGRPSAAARTPSFGLSQWNLVARRTAAGRDPVATLKTIRDYNADASLAVWQFLRMVNQEPRLVVTDVSGEGAPPPRAEEIVDGLASIVVPEYGGGVGVLVDILTLTLLTQGAVAAEIELDDQAREVVDLLPVNPSLIEFVVDEETGKRVPAVAGRGGAPVALPPEQFRYVPMDPDVGDPYGRSPLWPALDVAFFQAEVLRDLKAVVHNQGYPRIDVKVLREVFMQNVPDYLRLPGREEPLRVWLNGVLDDLKSAYEALNPDDAFIHWDEVETGFVGPGATGSLDLATVIKVLDSQVASSLKTLPVLLGRLMGAVQTHSDVQWGIWARGVGALRAKVAHIVGWLFTQALRIHGLQAHVRLEFTPIRTTDRLAEAQAAQVETDTAIRRWLAGAITQDEMAQELVGHEAVGPARLPELMPLVGPVYGEEEMGSQSTLPGVRQADGRLAAELRNTPSWMQVGYRRRRRQYRALLARMMGRAALAVESIPGDEWEAAGGSQNGRCK